MRISRTIAIAAMLFVALGFLIADSSPVIIESQESKNAEMKAVFNQIRFIPGLKQDVWMMNQSHFGRNSTAEKWERLAIVIDKTKTPMTAKFYQIAPGKLDWENSLVDKRVDYRAQCFSCHNNGPRAIRAEINSADAALGIRERLKIQAWNLRIKTYGRIVFDSTMDIEDSKFPTAFRDKDARMNELLKVGVCTHCHKEEGIFARGALRLQQRGTIQHLVETNQMPPLGFKMTQKEQDELQDFVRGFN